MCDRFTLRTPTKAIVQAFGLADAPDLRPRFNTAPTQQVAAIRLDPQTGTRQLALFRWGLVPSGDDDLSIGDRMINARAESVAIKPAFRSAFKKGHCLIVADGFYEWKKMGKIKQPFFVRWKDDEPFAFAGLSEHWHRGDQVMDSCTIITTEPNELMEGIHDRMPVILSPDDYDLWLEPDFDGQVNERLHRRVPLSRVLTSRTISSIRNGGKKFGSFSSLARHAVRILCLPDSFGS